jgi:hypothetical protein
MPVGIVHLVSALTPTEMKEKLPEPVSHAATRSNMGTINMGAIHGLIKNMGAIHGLIIMQTKCQEGVTHCVNEMALES